MLSSVRKARDEYPRQFWLLFWGLLISTTGASMIWPFLMVYVSAKLQLPLTVSASIMTVNSIMSIIFTFIAGPVTDRIGRKWVMVISLLGNGLVYLFYQNATTYLHFCLTAGLAGAFNPLFRVGADAMLADLIPENRRLDAYSLLRLSNNLGVALGPTIGGVLAATSYSIAFLFASFGMCTYGLMMLVLGKETIPQITRTPVDNERSQPKLGGYNVIFKDKRYIQFVGAFSLVQVSAALVWLLLSVYTKEQYGIPENLYGLLPATNGIMIVLMQLGITAWTRKHASHSMLAVGSAFYGIATFSIAFMTGFWGFWVSMVLLTIGEMILVPTSSTYAANLAPEDMRGRYLSLYSMTHGLAYGVGPVLGGLLSDNFGPKYTWYGGGFIGIVSVVAFILLQRSNRKADKLAIS